MIRAIARCATLTCVVGAFALAACGSDDSGSDATSVTGASVEPVPAITEAPPAATDAVSVPVTVDGTTAAPATDVAQTDVAQTDVAQTDVTATDAPEAGAGLTIVDKAFSAASVAAATEFTLTNDDDFAHTVTDRDGAFDVRVDGGSTSPLTIERAGTYEIFCRIHPSMSGTITVV